MLSGEHGLLGDGKKCICTQATALVIDLSLQQSHSGRCSGRNSLGQSITRIQHLVSRLDTPSLGDESIQNRNSSAEYLTIGNGFLYQ